MTQASHASHRTGKLLKETTEIQNRFRCIGQSTMASTEGNT
jgi:hypothetical protein